MTGTEDTLLCSAQLVHTSHKVIKKIDHGKDLDDYMPGRMASR